MNAIRTQKENEIDAFAAFFGQVLVGLKRHDLHRKFQGTNFAKTQESKIQMVHVK
jgi:hypothetical protein